MVKVRVDISWREKKMQRTEQNEMFLLCIKMQSLTSNSHIVSIWLYIYMISHYLCTKTEHCSHTISDLFTHFYFYQSSKMIKKLHQWKTTSSFHLKFDHLNAL